jgi:antitoxin Phd
LYLKWRKDAVVVISARRYAELTGQRQSFKDFLLNGPSLEGPERDKSQMRDVEWSRYSSTIG